MPYNTDSKLIMEQYAHMLEQQNGMSAAVMQYVDQMQIPGLPGAQFAKMMRPGDAYDAQVVHTIQSLIQAHVPAAQYRAMLMQVMQPEASAAMQQGLNAQQILQQLQQNPHIMSQHLMTAAQQLLKTTPVAAATGKEDEESMGGLIKSADGFAGAKQAMMQ